MKQNSVLAFPSLFRKTVFCYIMTDNYTRYNTTFTNGQKKNLFQKKASALKLGMHYAASALSFF